ncbi:MAG: CBS domain-containing protein [Thermoleophilia bacterium]|nr:CBS domain-containing protein [Thermoleophilia bacterium]
MPAVADHMSRDLLIVEPGSTIGAAAREMAARNVGTVLVVDEGRLVGILTERDVLRAVAAGWDENQPVSGRMTHNPETAESDDTTEHAAMLMIHGGFRHLPIVDDAEIVGILSIRDLVRVALDDAAPRGV